MYDYDTEPVGLSSYAGNLIVNVENYHRGECLQIVDVSSSGSMSQGNSICPQDIDYGSFFQEKMNFDQINFDDIYSQATMCMPPMIPDGYGGCYMEPSGGYDMGGMMGGGAAGGERGRVQPWPWQSWCRRRSPTHPPPPASPPHLFVHLLFL